jgi:hypothetical protein
LLEDVELLPSEEEEPLINVDSSPEDVLLLQEEEQESLLPEGDVPLISKEREAADLQDANVLLISKEEPLTDVEWLLEDVPLFSEEEDFLLPEGDVLYTDAEELLL